DFLDQHAMNLGVAVGAAVLEHDQTVVGVGGVAQGREHHAAGGDSKHHQSFDVVGAENHVEIGSGEASYSMLDDGDVAGLRCDGGMHLGAGFGDESPRLADRIEVDVARTDLRIARPEVDHDINNLQSAGARAAQHLRRAL